MLTQITCFYMFKTSCTMAKIAVDIDEEDLKMHYRVRKHILMAVIHDALATKHWPFLCTTQLCGTFLELLQWR